MNVSEAVMKQYTDENAEALTNIVYDLAPKWDKSLYETYNFITSLIAMGGRLEIIIDSYEKYGLDGLLQYDKILDYRRYGKGENTKWQTLR